jgi:hypothetical protein
MQFARQFNLNFMVNAGEVLQVFVRTCFQICHDIVPIGCTALQFEVSPSSSFNVRHNEGSELTRSYF